MGAQDSKLPTREVPESQVLTHHHTRILHCRIATTTLSHMTCLRTTWLRTHQTQPLHPRMLTGHLSETWYPRVQATLSHTGNPRAHTCRGRRESGLSAGPTKPPKPFWRTGGKATQHPEDQSIQPDWYLQYWPPFHNICGTQDICHTPGLNQVPHWETIRLPEQDGPRSTIDVEHRGVTTPWV
jgi:hypothetical protein